LTSLFHQTIFTARGAAEVNHWVVTKIFVAPPTNETLLVPELGAVANIHASVWEDGLEATATIPFAKVFLVAVDTVVLFLLFWVNQ